MERIFLPVLFLLLATANTVLATAGSGNGSHLDPENDVEDAEPARCRIPAYSDPARIIRQSAAIDEEKLLLEGRCYLACVPRINKQVTPQTVKIKYAILN